MRDDERVRAIELCAEIDQQLAAVAVEVECYLPDGKELASAVENMREEIAVVSLLIAND